MDKLPKEVVIYIMSYLEKLDLFHFGFCSKSYYELYDSKELWICKTHKDYPGSELILARRDIYYKINYLVLTIMATIDTFKEDFKHDIEDRIKTLSKCS